jgi:hypothetical protein
MTVPGGNCCGRGVSVFGAAFSGPGFGTKCFDFDAPAAFPPEFRRCLMASDKRVLPARRILANPAAGIFKWRRLAGRLRFF